MFEDPEKPVPSPIDPCLISGPAKFVEENKGLIINVVFTTVKGTLPALGAALGLAKELNAHTLLLVPQVVPRQFSISSPPVSIAFMQRRAYELAAKCNKEGEIQVQLYLCGDRRMCLLKALKPESLVVIGGRSGWWPSREKKLAGALQAAGHTVLFVDGK